MRVTSSTVTSSASGGHAAMACEIGLSRACRMLAVTEAATPAVSVSRTPHRVHRCGFVREFGALAQTV